MGRLNLLPRDYYDLTGPETAALLEGVENRQINGWRQTRMLATLIYNTSYTKPITEAALLPLPGDEEESDRNRSTDAEIAFAMMGTLFGGELTIEDLP